MRHLALIVALVLLAGCREAPAPPPAAKAPPDRESPEERVNLLNIGFGASVVSRTGELSLDNSALRAIDGNFDSPWNSPPDDPQQTLVFALPAPASIEQFGIRTQPGMFAVREALIETSMDGSRFDALKMQRFDASLELQIVPLQPPITARYFRMTISPTPGLRFATLTSVQARGRFLETPSVPDLGGCWTVNGQAAALTDTGGTLERHIGEPIVLDGGRDGAVYRFAWAQGPQWGHAIVTLSPDGRKLSAIKWHEEPIGYNYGESWFGERCGGGASPRNSAAGSAALHTVLRRAGRYPLYGPDPVATVGAVLKRADRIRLVSRDFRGQNAQARLDALRVTLQEGGVDISRIDFGVAAEPHQPIENAAMRALYSAVEIEIPAAARSAF